MPTLLGLALGLLLTLGLAYGAAKLHAPAGALILILLGIIFLLRNFQLLPFGWHLGPYWPLILVGIGAWMLFKRTAAGQPR